MAALVGQAAAEAYATSIAVAYSSTGSNLLVACIVHQSTTVSSVTDDAGNTWMLAADNVASASYGVGIWYCANAAKITQLTVTASAKNALIVNLSEWSGLSLASVDTNTASETATANTTSPACAVNASPNDLVIGACRYYNSAGTRVDSVGAPYVALAGQQVSSTLLAAAYDLPASAGSTGPAWTFTTGVESAVATAVFHQAVPSTLASSATDTLSFTATAALTDTLAPSGTDSLAFTAQAQLSDTIATTASGTLALNGATVPAGTLAIVGSGALHISGSPTLNGSSGMSATGSLALTVAGTVSGTLTTGATGVLALSAGVVPLPAPQPSRLAPPFGILTGHRQETWQWNLLGLDLSPAGTLDGVESATLEWSTQSTIKGGGTLNYTGTQDFSQVLVQPVYTATSAAGSQSWPLGVFHASTPETDWSDDAPAQQVELYDRLYELNVDQVDQTYTVQAGAGVGDAIRALVPSPLAMSDTSATVTTAMVWDIGTTKLQIVNDLLAAANYFSLWVDGYGTFHADPYVPPSARGIAWAFADDEFSIYDPAFTVSQDRFDVPNKVIEIAQSDGTTPALVSTATNTDPTSPTSYQARGNQWIVHVDQDVTAVSQAALDAIAQRQLVSLSHPSSTLAISHGHLPLLLNDAVTFRRTPAGINVTAVVQQLSVDTAGLTKTTLLEVTL